MYVCMYVLGALSLAQRKKRWLASCGEDRGGRAGQLGQQNARRTRNLRVFFIVLLIERRQSTRAQQSARRPKIEQEATKNRAKIVEKSILEPPGRRRSIRGRPGTPPGRRRGGQKRARGAPRALLGRPRASPSALGTCRGAPRTLRNAPEEVPRRICGALVSPNAHRSACGSIFNVFNLWHGSSDVRFVPLLPVFC